ncbi:MAG: TIGR00266 family protein [Oscillospiraceae bacterium]|jgi:uncharacterized protein (TIGR00266 family)|nr:TIGR00266 family protein [Oscillospiraceae bacterium]
MQHKIWGGTLPAVTITLEQGESIYTQSGGMSWMTDGIQMQTNMQGGFAKGLGRMFSGESLFMATYTAMVPNAEITLSSSMPGQIVPFQIAPGAEYVAQKGSFLCAQPGVTLSAHMARSFGSGFFGGEGFVMQHYSGQGLAFLEIDGSLMEYNLAPGQILKVDTGSVACFDASVGYSVERVKGFKNILFGGEGLFLTTLQGPGRVWLQTMTVSDLAGRISPFIATHSN